MDAKSALTASRRSLDARDESQWIPTINPMLRLVPQLRRSSEIQLLKGGDRFSEGPVVSQVRSGPRSGLGADPGAEKSRKSRKIMFFSSKNDFFKIDSPIIREYFGTIGNRSEAPKLFFRDHNCT